MPCNASSVTLGSGSIVKDGVVRGNVASGISLPIYGLTKQSYRTIPIQTSAHLNPSIIRLVIATVLFAMSLSRNVNMQ